MSDPLIMQAIARLVPHGARVLDLGCGPTCSSTRAAPVTAWNWTTPTCWPARNAA
jgi:hypothetical protein